VVQSHPLDLCGPEPPVGSVWCGPEPPVGSVWCGPEPPVGSVWCGPGCGLDLCGPGLWDVCLYLKFMNMDISVFQIFGKIVTENNTF
jgi:hypothetical protein